MRDKQPIGVRPLGESNLDPGNPPERGANKRNPLAPETPDVTNEWNCQPHLEDAFSEVLAGMSKDEQVGLVRSILLREYEAYDINPTNLNQLLSDVRHWMQDAAHEEGNY